MQSKWKLNFMLILCIISLISVGFSSWIFSGNSTIVIGTILTDDVVNMSFFKSLTVQSFTLGPDGLVEDYTIVSSTSFKVIIEIDNEKAYDASNNGNITFQINLTCSDQDFLQTYIGNPTITNSTSLTSEKNGDTLTTSVTYPISNNIGTTTMTVIYTVTDDGNINAYNSNKPTFDIKVGGN